MAYLILQYSTYSVMYKCAKRNCTNNTVTHCDHKHTCVHNWTFTSDPKYCPPGEGDAAICPNCGKE